MKKRLTTAYALSFTLLTLITSPLVYANCANCDCDPCKGTFYMAASGSIIWHNDLHFQTDIEDEFEFKRGWGSSISAGGIFDMVGNWDIRLEVEFLYRKNKIKNLFIQFDDFSETIPIAGYNRDMAIMANFIIDVAVCCGFSIYYGAGIGASRNKIIIHFDDLPETNKDTLFAWQILAGISYFVFSQVEINVGYRLFATGKTDNFNTFNLQPVHFPFSQGAEIGVRVRF